MQTKGSLSQILAELERFPGETTPRSASPERVIIVKEEQKITPIKEDVKEEINPH